MFHQIINSMANHKNWSPSLNGMDFDCSEFDDEDIDLIFDFLSIYDIKPSFNIFSSQEKETEKKLILSQTDFKTLFNAFKSYKKDKNLLKNANLYDPLNAEDWEYLKQHISLKVNYKNKQKINFKKEKDIFQIVRENTPYSILARRIFNEFIIICREKEMISAPFSLTIDMTDEILNKLEKEQAFGLAFHKKGQPYIYIQNNLYERNFTSCLLHEIRHIIQTEHALNPCYFINGELNGICKTMSELARETEAKSYDLIVSPSKTDFTKSITTQITHQNARMVTQKPSLVPYAPDLSKAQKIAAGLRYLQIESHEKSLQLLCDLHLSASRVNIYKLLKKNQINIDIKNFKDLVQHVEDWKSYYLPRTVYYHIKDKQKTFTTFDEHIKKIEERWLLRTGLDLSLSPKHVFSQSIAQSLGVSSLIYPQKEKTNSQIVYKGFNETTPIVSLLFKEKQFEEIYQLYEMIQQQNPILPPVYRTQPLESGAYYYMIALMNMKDGKSLQNVLPFLGYPVTDQFNPNGWRPPVSTMKNSSQRQRD